MFLVSLNSVNSNNNNNNNNNNNKIPGLIPHPKASAQKREPQNKQNNNTNVKIC